MFLLFQVFGAVQDRLGEQTGFNIMTADFEERIIYMHGKNLTTWAYFAKNGVKQKNDGG